MTKDELVTLIQVKKEAKVAEVSADFDALLEAANALEVSPDVMALQAQLQSLTVQVADLNTKLDAANAEIVKDIAALADEKSVEEKLIAKIAAIKAALEG